MRPSSPIALPTPSRNTSTCRTRYSTTTRSRAPGCRCGRARAASWARAGHSPAVAAHPFTTRITVNSGVTGYSSPLTFLPVPYAPQDVEIHGGWQDDPSTLMVFQAHGQLSGLSYSVTSDDVEPSLPQLEKATAPPASIAKQYLSFPSPAKKQLLALAKQIT